MSYCLPPKLASAFVSKLKDGTINPADLADMSSAKRREFFEPIVGAENAQEVNALFEAKLLQKDVKRGLVTWAKQVGGITEPVRKDLLAKIQRMPNELLNPVDESKFLADLAATKLGVTVTADEAKQIFDLAQAADAAEAAMKYNMNIDTQIAYGKAKLQLVETVEAMKPAVRTLGERVLDVASISKSSMATLDLSAPGVQGFWSMATPEFWEGLPKMFQMMKGERFYQNLRGYIAGHPDLEVFKQGKLGIVELSDKLSVREEAIQSSLVEKANEYFKRKYGVPNVVRATNRAFVGFMLHVRVKGAERLIRALRMAGEDVSPGSDLARQVMNVMNDSTGRGAIGTGDKYAGFTPLNTVIWTPRKISATLNMMNPWNYMNPAIHPLVRRERLRRLVGSIAITGTALGLADLAGYEVNLNPTSTDFLRVKAGKTSFDLSGGNVSYLRLMARLLFNEAVTSRGTLIEYGEGFRAPTRADAVIDFIRGKFNPVPAAVLADALYGKDPIGRPFTLTGEMSDKLVPMTINNFLDLAVGDPNNTAAAILAPLTVFGVGMYVQQETVARGRWDVWGAPNGTDHSDSPVVQKLEELGIEANMPANNIRGVKLTERLYDEYSFEAGRLMQEYLGAAVATPGFDQGSPGEQEAAIRASMAQAREDARMYMLGKYDDLIMQSDALKQRRMEQGSPTAIARRAAQ